MFLDIKIISARGLVDEDFAVLQSVSYALTRLKKFFPETPIVAEIDVTETYPGESGKPTRINFLWRGEVCASFMFYFTCLYRGAETTDLIHQEGTLDVIWQLGNELLVSVAKFLVGKLETL